MPSRGLIALGICVVAAIFSGRGAADECFRRPIGLVLSDDSRLAYAANRDSGSVSIIDTARRRVCGEFQVGGRPSSIAMVPDQQIVVVADFENARLILLAIEGKSFSMRSVVSVGKYPVDVVVAPDGKWCFVASLWSRRWTAISLQDIDHPRVTAVLDLPFAPREQLLLPDNNHLLVADSFGGKLAVIDVLNRKLVKIRDFDGHNIRGLVNLSGRKHVAIAHQILHRDGETTRGGVHWGDVMSNVARTVKMDELTSGDGDLGIDGVYYLGHPDHAAGDPAGMAATADRRQIVAFSGIDEIGISDRGANYFQPVKVGRYPTQLALNRDESLVYVVNTFSDSISVVDVQDATVDCEISLGKMPLASVVRQGEMLFHDARLSSDGWYSCHACHTDGHTTGRLNDNFSDGSIGAPKRVLSLLGVADTAPWAWNGHAKSLEGQIRKSIETTMRGPRPSQRQVTAIAAYIESLAPPPSLAESRGGQDPRLSERGAALFGRLQCNNCHSPPSFTSQDAYDVGIHDLAGNREFNPPSLRGVSQREHFFHDNRATTLKDVFAKFKHSLEKPLTDDELATLIAYLNSI